MSARGRRTEDVGTDVGAIAQGNANVGGLDDAADVAPQFVAGGGGIAQGAGRLGGEDAGCGVQRFQDAQDVGVLGKLNGAPCAQRHHRRAEIDRRRAEEFMHHGRNLDAVLDVAVLIQRVDESTQVGHRRVVQLVDLASDTVGELRQVQARRGLDRTQYHPTDQEADGLPVAVMEFAVVRSQA